MDITQIFNGVLDGIDFFTYYDYSKIIFFLKIIAGIASTVFFYGIIYSSQKIKGIMERIHAYDTAKSVPKEKPKNVEEWKKILEKAGSGDENERKFAIIAADSLMEKILGLAGYHGENLGEKLKMIERGDLDSLDDIWEAHKVRNRIAHEADFSLSQNETKLAIFRFEKALKELEYI